MSDGRDDKVIEWLIAECHDTSKHLVDMWLLGERILATSVAVLTLAVSLAVNANRAYLLMGLPFALSILIVYVLYLNMEVISLGGYKAALEEELTRRAGVPIIFWESRIARMRHRSFPAYCIRVVACLFLVGSMVIAVAEALATRSPKHWGHEHAGWYILATFASIGIGIAAIAISFVSEMRSHKQVLSLAQATMLGHIKHATDI